MAKTYTIAIDGPAGAGKSTIARALAKELGYYYVDTGAIYRTVAYFLDLLGISPKDVDGVERYLDELTIQIEYDETGKQHMLMNGMDVTDDIRTPDISQKASLVSAHAMVRHMLLDMQRAVAKKHNVIMDGRDIGTVVLPKATVKIFLTASAEVRAKRRMDEFAAKGQKVAFEQVLKDIQQRDHQDSTRPIAPLKQAKDAVLLDTSELDIPGVIAAMKKIIGEKIPL
ncbi:MAG: (d)CMP kinase [Oscillospiraceae bacterium]|nr:(d)CMP kinase [Oscillospiraceae bacterium]